MYKTSMKLRSRRPMLWAIGYYVEEYIEVLVKTYVDGAGETIYRAFVDDKCLDFYLHPKSSWYVWYWFYTVDEWREIKLKEIGI